jgi:hypothetical protein
VLPDWAVGCIAGGFSLLAVVIILMVKLDVFKFETE